MTATCIAAQMYTVREFCRTPADIAASMAKIARAGYGAVQVSGVGPITPQELKRVLDDNGLFCCATHTGWERLTGDLPGLIAELKALDCPYTALGSMPGEFHNADGVRRAAVALNQAGKALRQEGIWLGYHNHSFEFEKYQGKLCFEWLYELTEPENVFAEIDTYWVQHGGGDPAAWIRRYRGRIPVIHFKDMGVIQEKPAMLEVGEGNLNWPEIIKACRGARVKWYAVEQDHCNGRDPFESLAISLRNLKAMGLK